MKDTNILNKAITRRSFVLGMSLTATGTVLGLFPSISSTAKIFSEGAEGEILSFAPNVFLRVDPDNTVTVVIARSELGQGIRTTFSMILAEELDADWEQIKAEQAEGDSKYGNQSTGGSTSVRTFWNTLRLAGATARDMFITAAATIWGIDKSGCRTEAGYVIETNGQRKLSYGELTEEASKLPVPPSNKIKLKNKSEFKIIGTDRIHLDTHEIVSGKAIYGMDFRLPDMKFAVLAQRPVFGSSVKSFDDAETLKIKGVIRTLQIPEGVAVIAENTWAAMKGVEVLRVEWDLGPNAARDTEQIMQSLYDKVGTLPELPSNTAISLDNVIYELPYLAHATMEPMNATARYKDNRLEVWVPTQDPQTTRNVLANTFSMNISNITVKTTLCGGGFGRRLQTDYSIIAARIARATGLTVKAVYTRADDMKHDYYRPASIHAMRGGIDSSGMITGWIHKSVFAGSGSPTAPPYKINNVQNLTASGLSFIPTGPWRSVTNTQVIFANECFLDEIAELAGKDPMDFRLDLVLDNRLRKVLTLVKEKSDWTRKLPEGWGRGVATFVGYGGYIAHVVEVSVNTRGKLKVERIVSACDIGVSINPINIKAQIEGAAHDALSTAIKAEITIKNGGVVQSGYHDYPWIRMEESPKIESYLISEENTPGGMGEVGFPAVSPALINAIYNATGVRIRKLPISEQKLTTGIEEKKNSDGLNLEVIPNPFVNSFVLKIGESQITGAMISVVITSIRGEKVLEFTRNLSSGYFEERIDLKNLSAGVYLMKVSKGKYSETIKIIKQ